MARNKIRLNVVQTLPDGSIALDEYTGLAFWLPNGGRAMPAHPKHFNTGIFRRKDDKVIYCGNERFNLSREATENDGRYALPHCKCAICRKNKCQHVLDQERVEIAQVGGEDNPINVHVRCLKCSMVALKTLYVDELDWEVE